MTGVFHIVVAMKPTEGNFAENGIKHGIAGLNIDGCRIGTRDDTSRMQGVDIRGGNYVGSKKKSTFVNKSHILGRFPANVILGGPEVVEGLDRQSDWNKHNNRSCEIVRDVGGGCASRFFKRVVEYQIEVMGNGKE